MAKCKLDCSVGSTVICKASQKLQCLLAKKIGGHTKLLQINKHTYMNYTGP